MAKRRPWRVEFTYKGEPLTKSNAHKFYRGKVRIPKKIKDYEEGLKQYARKVMRRTKRRPTKSLVKVRITYYVGTTRTKDLQNLPKTTLDALNEIVYKDDKQVHELHIKKRLDRNNPRIHIVIQQTQDSNWKNKV